MADGLIKIGEIIKITRSIKVHNMDEAIKPTG